LRTNLIRGLVSDRLREVRVELFGANGGPELARRIGVPARSWTNYEGGVTVPGEVALAFLEVTACSPHWLLTGEGPKYEGSFPGFDGQEWTQTDRGQQAEDGFPFADSSWDGAPALDHAQAATRQLSSDPSVEVFMLAAKRAQFAPQPAEPMRSRGSLEPRDDAPRYAPRALAPPEDYRSERSRGSLEPRDDAPRYMPRVMAPPEESRTELVHLRAEAALPELAAPRDYESDPHGPLGVAAMDFSREHRFDRSSEIVRLRTRVVELVKHSTVETVQDVHTSLALQNENRYLRQNCESLRQFAAETAGRGLTDHAPQRQMSEMSPAARPQVVAVAAVPAEPPRPSALACSGMLGKPTFYDFRPRTTS
jgi:hypothetical protein